MITSLTPQRDRHLKASSPELDKPTANTESVSAMAARGISELEAFLAEQPVKATPALVYA